MPDETPTPAATPTATPSPTPSPTPAPAPQTVTIPAEQLTSLLALQTRISQLEQEQRQREQAATEERVRLLTQKGEAENAVKTLRESKDAELQAERGKLVQTEERAKRYALEGELARALSAQPLASPAAAQQLALLFRGEFQVHAEGDSFTVRTPTFQSVGDFVKQQLARPEFAHFVKANTQGGAGGQFPQSTPTPGATPTSTPGPKNLGEAIVLHMQGLTRPDANAQTDMTRPYGLSRVAN